MNDTERLEHLQSRLKFLEDEEDYYAMFSFVVANYFQCREELQTLLFTEKLISHHEYTGYLSRIEEAFKKAVHVHLEWTVKRLSENKNHTVETVVYSVYNDLFPGYVPTKNGKKGKVIIGEKKLGEEE